MANRLRDFALAEPIFIDANIFVYQQTAHPDFGPDSRDFLNAVELGRIEALTSALVLNEVLYVLQVQRAGQLLGTSNRGVIHAQLSSDPSIVAASWSAVEQCLDLVDALMISGLAVVDVTSAPYRRACKAGRQFSLVVSDATHVAVCHDLGITHIASNDGDLDRVPFLTRWAPQR